MPKKKKTTVQKIQTDLDKNKTAGLPDLSQFKTISKEILRLEADEWVYGVYRKMEEIEIDQEKDGKVEVHKVQAHFLEDAYTEDDQEPRVISIIGGVSMDEAIEDDMVKQGDTVFIRSKGDEQTRKGNRVNIWDIRVLAA